ncbi:hypothetical protein ASF33_02420 [Methylobacterium sp. Leaf92]|nr:hypothetical protein ASF33_02420 [Methylobacterium sp. Leaf92]
MIVDTLALDLLRDSALITLFKTSDDYVPGKLRHTEIRIQLPTGATSDRSESNLQRAAIEAAKAALREAIETLEKQES